ncbi:MAG: thiamine pyrophosphate-dependent enzyme [Thermodesulfobacteriota bacterium]|nr:thiamine pyrophosphate-dependent enzyme [Thermodesulfobacteriota bacterium]
MTEKEMIKEVVCEPPRLRLEFMPIIHCPGCHYGIIVRILCEVIDELGIEDRTIGLGGGGCTGFWTMYFNLDMFGGVHGPGIAIATALKRVHPDSIVFAAQGDGEMGAIGLGYFMAATLRGEKITTIFLNNACFGTTGGQMAPTTLLGMPTTTTTQGRDPKVTGFPFHGAELAASMKGTAYSARVSVHTPANRQKAKKAVREALEKQMAGVGFTLVEFLSACPVNWRMGPKECLDFIENQMIVEYPLGVFKDVDYIENLSDEQEVRT